MPNFYADLPAQPANVAMCGFAAHTPLPHGWSVAVVDIAGSTQAIARGRYKDVNIAASCAIIAALNAIGRAPIPYVYGGDGATILIPNEYGLRVAQALHGARVLARGEFGLEMRAGLVPASDLAPVRVAKIETSPGVVQAALSGDGVTQAEKLVKGPDTGPKYDIERLFAREQLEAIPADFTGLECRWQPLKSRNGLDVSLIVQARGESRIYQDLLRDIEAICGAPENWRPADESNLAVSIDPAKLMHETRVRTHGQSLAARVKYLLNILALSAVGKICFVFGLKAGHFDGRTYKRDTAARSDYIKFDNALRIVMDITPDQRQTLEAHLESLRAQEKIFYGLHAASAALMTCMVFDYADAHFHFIDGSDGGYAMAARQLKAQMALAGSQSKSL